MPTPMLKALKKSLNKFDLRFLRVLGGARQTDVFGVALKETRSC